MKDIFEFNRIDKSLSESEVKTLKDWCFKRSYKSYKFLLFLGVSLTPAGQFLTPD